MSTLQQWHDPYVGIQKAFEKALYTYDDAAFIQREASGLLINYLVQIKPSPKQALDLGCGTGFITMQLCKVLRISALHINDFSQIMLDKACLRLQTFQPKVLLFNFDHAWHCKDSYDLIFSNMAFQWSFNIPELFKKCYNHLNRNGILAFSLPLKGSCFKLNPHQCIPFLEFDTICQWLSEAGFTILKSDQILLYQEFKTHLQALKSIKECGANYVFHKTSSQVMNRAALCLPSTLKYNIGIFIVTKGL